MKCQVEGCDGKVEAAARIWFNLDDEGNWSVYGVSDEDSTITCDENGHDNFTNVLDKSLSAFIEELLPGSTWVGSSGR